MGLWEKLFGSKARHVSRPNRIAGRIHPRRTERRRATIVHRRFESPFKIGDRIGGRYEVRRILGRRHGHGVRRLRSRSSECPRS